MKKYWWIISIIISSYVGGEGPDDETYPVQHKRIFKFFGPADEETYQKIISEISYEIKRESTNRRVDFIWCLGETEEDGSVFAQILYVYLKKYLSE